jgi:uncharacterized protein (TIGR02270 family)
MLTATRSPVQVVVLQHLENAVSQRNLRTAQVRAPHVKLHHLRRLDDRLAASLDGLALAGDSGRALCLEALRTPARGSVFTAAIGAIASQDSSLLNRLLATAETLPEARAGLMSAFGWVSSQSLRGITKALLDSNHPFHRSVGLNSCAMHLVNPGTKLSEAIADPDVESSVVALAGRLARLDLLPASLSAMRASEPELQFKAARGGLFLGDRQTAVHTVSNLAQKPGPTQTAALVLVLKVLEPADTHALLRSLAQDPGQDRSLIRGAGAAGDPYYIPWLIKQMANIRLARLAGESFSMITGLDLAYLDLDARPPEGAVFGPNDDPADADVAMDEDDSLPWPDVEKISSWWQSNGSRFQPGTRYFVGEPPSVVHCISVLKNGFQRHRIAAAEYLCLLQPGTPLFNVAAPAWRQQRLLAQMGA